MTPTTSHPSRCTHGNRLVESPDEVGRIAADAISRLLADSDSPVLGLATGSSPLPVYADLIERHERGQLSFAATTMFLLDEYVGHPQPYRSFIRWELTNSVNVRPGLRRSSPRCPAD
jgi:glucosamine-6-phosphate deaminase